MSQNNKYILGIIVCLLLLFVLFLSHSVFQEKDALTTPSTNAGSKIFIKGSDTILPVSIAESKIYMDLHPGNEIIVIGGGSSLGLASFIEGEVEIAMASRKIKESEITSATNKGIEPVETIIGWDGISVIVNKNNPLESLSVEQLQMVYSGEITNWKELGGNDEKIRVLVRDQSSGTYGFFKEHVLGDKAYTKNAIIEPNTEAVVKDVSLSTASIGYIGLAYMDESVKMIGLGTSEGIFYPNANTIRRGTYPLSRPLYYYTDGEPEGTVKEYIDFVLSAQGQEILSDIGYLPVN
jgi:phosphate transport system substrate-binding protein